MPYGVATGHRVARDSCGAECTHHRELARLRRDLHDGLGPSLAGILIRADLLARLMTGEEDPGQEVLHDLRREASTFLAEMRRLLTDRGPVELDGHDLAGGLSVLAERMSRAPLGPSGQRLVIRVDVADDVDTMNWAAQVTAFWIVKEALTNVVKHAHADVCTVRVRVDRGLRLSVVDNGHGGLTESGLGLGSMRERAAELGGWCDVTDTGQGIAVTAHLPEGQASHDRAA